jgi:hypothetical protein
MTGDTTHTNAHLSLSPGVIVLTLAVLVIVFMVGFHLMNLADIPSSVNQIIDPVSVSGGLLPSAYDDMASSSKAAKR